MHLGRMKSRYLPAGLPAGGPYVRKQDGDRLGVETSGPLLLNVWCRSVAWVQGRSDSSHDSIQKLNFFSFYGATKSQAQ